MYFQLSSGEKPVKVFINEQEGSTQVKIIRLLEHMEEFGTRVGAPHVKKLVGTELWELRILGANNIRIFYIAVEQQTFLMLHGFKKKTQKTEKKEIRLAEERLSEYRARKKN
jgi:phage-related protein